jgi:hypothetical protein
MLGRLFRFRDGQAERTGSQWRSLPEFGPLFGGQILQHFVDLELSLVHVIQQVIDLEVHHTPRRDCRSAAFSKSGAPGSSQFTRLNRM